MNIINWHIIFLEPKKYEILYGRGKMMRESIFYFIIKENMPRKRIPEFKTDEIFLWECLTPRPKSPELLKSEKSQPPEIEEKTDNFWVLIRKHTKTGAKYLEVDDMKIWIFPYEKKYSDPAKQKEDEEDMKRLNIDKEGYATITPGPWQSTKRKSRQRIHIPPYVTRMICTVWGEQRIFSNGKNSLIPEEQKNLFGYQEYAHLFPDTDLSLNYELDPGDDYHPTIKAVIYLCLIHKIPSRHVSDLVRMHPPVIYRIARTMDMTFDYADKFKGSRIPYKEWRRSSPSRLPPWRPRKVVK